MGGETNMCTRSAGRRGRGADLGHAEIALRLAWGCRTRPGGPAEFRAQRRKRRPEQSCRSKAVILISTGEVES